MTSKRWAVIFFISLAVNIFLIAVIAAGLWGWRGDRPQFRPGLYTVPWASRVIGEDTRPRARDVFRAHRDDYLAMRRSFRPLHEAVREALTADPFDPAALDTALARLRAQGELAQQQTHGMMGEFAAGLSAEQRQKLGIAIDRMIERRARRGERLNKRWEKMESKEGR